MGYKTIRDTIEDMAKDNHKDFVKAVISMEKGINDESALDSYMMLIWTMTPLICYMRNLTI